MPPGVRFGGDGEAIGGVQFVSATPDLSHVVLASSEPLTLDTKPQSGGQGNLYEFSAGRLQAVSVLPSHEAVAGSLGDGGNYEAGNVRHAISNDGSRVVWESPSGHYYLRDMTREETVQLDAARGVAQPNSASSQYQTANGEGSRVFFTSTGPLTVGSTAAGEGQGDLYVFEVTSGAGEPLQGTLTDLTVDSGADETAAVQGVLGASEDGSYVYFVANGVLGDGAEHGARSGDCVSASGGRSEQAGLTCNLYVEHYNGGAWEAPVFIAALSGDDGPSWGSASAGRELKGMTSRVSPNGRWLAFSSQRSLTGYDNTDANSPPAEPHADEEVYVYDAASEHLTCASCDPTGARPDGVLEQPAPHPPPLVDYAETWPNRWLAGNIPGWTSNGLSTALYQSRYLSDSGRLYFNSPDALVPGDVNGTQDVYEYEPAGIPEGEHACTPASTSAGDVFKPAHAFAVEGQSGVEGAGCVGLISAGTSSEESAFLDASETGGDVFFLTSSKLAPQDRDTSLDVYDAHECTTQSPCAPPPVQAPPACVNEAACKPAPEPQPTVFGLPASATFSGPGNVAASPPAKPAAKPLTRAQKLAHALRLCRKDRAKKKRSVCEKRARSKYGTVKKASRAGKGRRTRR